MDRASTRARASLNYASGAASPWRTSSRSVADGVPFTSMTLVTPQNNHAGDGENDVEFVRDAGLGVAMKNGRDAVKQVAKRVTARTNAEDGVAHELSMLQAEGVLPQRN